MKTRKVRGVVEMERVAPRLRVVEDWEEGVRVLRLAGDLDAATEHLVRWRLRAAALDLSGPALSVDLRQVDFLDSLGLTTLLGAHRALAGRGRRLRVLVQPGSQPLRVMEITHLTSILDVVCGPPLRAEAA